MTYPEISPARWWRDDETRYLSRAEYSEHRRRPRFELAAIPRINPELDDFVDRYFARQALDEAFDFIKPLEFEQLEPNPLADVMVAMRYPPLPVEPFVMFFGTEDDV